MTQDLCSEVGLHQVDYGKGDVLLLTHHRLELVGQGRFDQQLLASQPVVSQLRAKNMSLKLGAIGTHALN